MFRKLFCSVLLVTLAGAAHAEGKLNVVATTTFNADLVRKIGGDRVEVKSVAPPKFDIHFIQPKPSDVKNVSKADVYVNSGLDLEAWSDPLVEAAGRPEFFRGGSRSVDLSEGIRLLKVPTGALSRSLGDMHLFGNPHYHLSPENAKIMSATLADKLAKLDPGGADDYRKNQQAFAAELDSRMVEWRSECSHCVGKEVYSYHEDMEYLSDFLGLKCENFMEPKPGIPPTPKHIQELGEYGKAHQVKAILQATYFPSGSSEALAKRIGASVVTIAQNVGEVPEAADIFALYDHDVKHIAEALK